MKQSTRFGRRAGLVAALVVATAGIGWTDTLAGSAFTVTRFDDPAPGPCEPGDCSLREAVMAANATQVADVIRLPSGRYELNIPWSEPDYGWQSDEMGDLDISQNLTIRNIGPGRLATVDANGATNRDRAFEIAPATIAGASRLAGSSAVEVTFVGVGITGGYAASGDARFLDGGGIRIGPDASLTMKDGLVSRNQSSASGGGLFVDRGIVRLSRVRLVRNRAIGGGAVGQHLGRLEMVDSVARGNDGGLHGGALETTGLAILDRMLLVDNEAAAGGAALTVEACGSARLTDTTISGNGPNGAIVAHNGSLFLSYSTVSDNTGPGVYVDDDDGDGCPGEAYLRGTIIAGNRVRGDPGTASDCRNGDPDPLIHSLGHNLVGDGTDCDLTAATGDRIGTHAAPVDARLVPLAFNGGAMPSLLTHRLRPGSPAVDSADPGAGCAIGLAVDLRGVPRGLGGRCDKGAYELVACHGVVVNRVGTPRRDAADDPAMRGTGGDDGILGLGGDDTLAGQAGGDGLCGGPGRDDLSGGDGDDKLAGGPDRDVCSGDAGRDVQTGCEVTRGIP